MPHKKHQNRPLSKDQYHGFIENLHRDGLVNGTDQIIARGNQTNPLNMLRLITAPPVDTGEKQSLAEESDPPQPSAAELNWLYELQQMNHRDTKRTSPAEAAVDRLLATYW